MRLYYKNKTTPLSENKRIDQSLFTSLPDGRVMFNGRTYKNKRSAESAEWGSRNKERRAAFQKTYQARNRDKARAYVRERTRTDEKFRINKRDKAREWKHKNLEKLKAQRIANRETILKWKAGYRKRHAESLRKKQSEYRKLNPSKILNQCAKRRAKMSGHVAHSEMIQALYLFASTKAKKTCYYCKNIFTCPVHVDHVIPLAKGGLHVIENLCFACPSCNLAKGSKLPEQMIQSQKILTL